MFQTLEILPLYFPHMSLIFFSFAVKTQYLFLPFQTVILPMLTLPLCEPFPEELTLKVTKVEETSETLETFIRKLNTPSVKVPKGFTQVCDQ